MQPTAAMDLALSRSDFEFMGRKDGAAFDTLMVGGAAFDVDPLMGGASGHEQLVPGSPDDSDDEGLQHESFDLSFDWAGASSLHSHQKAATTAPAVNGFGEGDLFSFGAGEELGEGVNWDLINSSSILAHSPTFSPTSVMNIPGISLSGSSMAGLNGRKTVSSTAGGRKASASASASATGSSNGRMRTGSKSSKASRKSRPSKDDGRVPSSRPTSPVKGTKRAMKGQGSSNLSIGAKDDSESAGPQLGPDGLPVKKIGAYTLEQRKARIDRFHAKRKRRIWEKRIKYDCRKKLADSRPRVKGRFVKRTPEELAAEAAAKAAAKAAAAQAKAEAKARAAAERAALQPPAKRQATVSAMAELRVPTAVY